jgi:signal transduction histidine kinase
MAVAMKPWLQRVVAAVALVAAVVAVWVTLDADFLAHPGWLAVQKADFILGPVLVGLYWLRVRPRSRFGPLLIAYGFVMAVYILQSSDDPLLFGIGVWWENVIYVATQGLILTFPTGRLDGLVAKLILLVGCVAAAVPATMINLVLPQYGPDGSLSGCRALCPENGLAITSDPSLALDVIDGIRVTLLALAFATIGLLVWRVATGTRPQRRALAIGTPIAVLFLLAQIAHQGFKLLARDAAEPPVLQWLVAGARSLIWYGFWFALIAAQLFAGRALHRLVRQSLRRPSQRELEAMLREPLGDPELRLVFWDLKAEAWAGAVNPEPGRAVAVVERDDRPAVAMIHDPQLDDDPELLQAAGAVALLAAENADLDAAWNDALGELGRSRARIVRAGDNERRKLERNLHDGVQQRLVGVRINLALASDVTDEPIRGTLDGIGESVDEAIDELRDVAHGLYPPVLNLQGLVAALEHIRVYTATPLTIRADGIGRHPAELESAVYYSCLEAIQNATKYGGPAVDICVALRENADELLFEVIDDGPGFDLSEPHDGTGLQNMRDRIGALEGRLSIVTAPGNGTVVEGTVPLRVIRSDSVAADRRAGDAV